MKTFIIEQLTWLKGLLSDKDGKASTKSVATLGMIFVFAFNYNRIAWSKTDLLDIPEQWAIFILLALGLKVWDNKVQNDTASIKSELEALKKKMETPP